MELNIDRYMTPEEKLLKLIRKKDQALVLNKGIIQSQKIGEFKQNVNKEKSDFEMLVFFNRLFVFLIIGISGYVLARYFIFPHHDIILSAAAVVDHRKPEQPKEILLEVKPFIYYEQKIMERNFFEFPWEKTNPQANTSVTNAELSNQIRVTGIVLDNDPKAIIEDIKNNQTVFLSKGESIAGAMIEEIKADKVIFNYNDQHIEMTP